MPGKGPSTVLMRLARWRVPLGFAGALIVFILADPTWIMLIAGALVAAVGESVRMWAAGHLEKGRGVTMSGPYRWVGHPLYIGSTVMGLGLALASRSLPATVVIILYVGVTIGAAIRTEQAALSDRFGDTYEAYRAGSLVDLERRFSLARALRNREPRAAAGLAAAFGLLAIKLIL